MSYKTLLENNGNTAGLATEASPFMPSASVGMKPHLAVNTVNDTYTVTDSGIAESVAGTLMPAVNTEPNISDRILELSYDRGNKERISNRRPILHKNLQPSIHHCVNVAYAFVRRILDSEGTDPVIVYSQYTSDVFAWGNCDSCLIPSEGEVNILASLCKLIIAQADAIDSSISLLVRLKQTQIYQGSPKEVKALLEAALSRPDVFYLSQKPYYRDNRVNKLGWEIYMEFLHELRTVCRRMQLRKDLYDRNIKMPAQRFDSIKHLLAELFEVFDRVLVVRVDLKYQPAHARDVSFEQHQQYTQQVMKAVDIGQPPFTGCLGYAVRMEDAPEAGLHSHWAFFFDGRKCQHDLAIAKAICDWWCSTVTQETGAAWNINAHWQEQIKAGKVQPEDYVLGMINRIDEAKVLKMVQVMGYLCHAGQDVLYKPSKNAKTFFAKPCNLNREINLSFKQPYRPIFQRSRSPLQWEDELCGLSLAQLAPEKINRLLTQAGLPQASTTALGMLGLLHQGAPTNAAKLFLAHQPIQLRCKVFGGTNSAIATNTQGFYGDILSLMNEAEIFILQHIRIDTQIQGVSCVDVPESVVKAMREALANAFCHRDWDASEHIKVIIFKDRIEICSPGLLYGGLTIDEMRRGNTSRCRNPRITKVLRSILPLESKGHGMSLILENAPDTSFFEIGNSFVTCIRLPSALDAAEAETASTEECREARATPEQTGTAAISTDGENAQASVAADAASTEAVREASATLEQAGTESASADGENAQASVAADAASTEARRETGSTPEQAVTEAISASDESAQASINASAENADASAEATTETLDTPLKRQKKDHRKAKEILRILQLDPSSTAKDLAQQIGITERGVRYHLNQLKKKGQLRHIGPNKGGHWEVIEQDEDPK